MFLFYIILSDPAFGTKGFYRCAHTTPLNEMMSPLPKGHCAGLLETLLLSILSSLLSEVVEAIAQQITLN